MTRRRLGVVGPSSSDSDRGGIVDHTTHLAYRLQRDGHTGVWVSWSRQFPRLPGRGDRRGSDDAARGAEGPTLPVPDLRWLDWSRPATWRRTGRRLAEEADVLILVATTALQYPALRTIASTFRRAGAAVDPQGSRSVVLVLHNVTPHERYPGDRRLVAALMDVADRVVVHSHAEVAVARSLTTRPVVPVPLPYHPPQGLAPSAPEDLRHDRLLMLGFVRPYKGLDTLLHALSRASVRPALLVRGEFWQRPGHYQRLIDRLGLADRVELRPGFAGGVELSELLRASDALVMPYHSGTASQFPQVAFDHGVPVIASDVGDLTEKVHHDVDGLVVSAADVGSLAAAINRFYGMDGEEGRRSALRRGVVRPEPDAEWADYLDVLLDGRG